MLQVFWSCFKAIRTCACLQALLHAPLLRNYFLGGGHSPALCPHRERKPCLSCELVRLDRNECIHSIEWFIDLLNSSVAFGG